MVSAGNFTTADRATIGRAALVAEHLTQRYFGLACDEWKAYPYRIFSSGKLDHSLIEPGVLAQTVRLHRQKKTRDVTDPRDPYGVVLVEPNILLSLLRSEQHDLWTLGLFILTHELTHIIRFRRFKVDFFAPVAEREREERLVQGITRDILTGAVNTDYLIRLYEKLQP
jgi:hypothetical protein